MVRAPDFLTVQPHHQLPRCFYIQLFFFTALSSVMEEIPVNKSNATINSMTALKTVEGSYSLTNLGVSFHERFCSAEHDESYLASIIHEAVKFCHLSIHFTANKHQLKGIYLSTGASSQKKPLRILSSRVTPSRMLVWRVWFCLQDLSSTQDLHTESQGGNSGIQWLSRLLRCFSDFHAAVFFSAFHC